MKQLALISFFIFLTLCASAQTDTLRIEDNTATMEQMTSYIITPDSLVILARSDYGRTRFDYLHRALTKKEKEHVKKLLSTFPFDSLKEVYFNDYSNYTIIDADHFPRVLDIIVYRNGKLIQSKATNAWVKYFAELIDKLNPMMPAETRIQYDKTKFNAFY